MFFLIKADFSCFFTCFLVAWHGWIRIAANSFAKNLPLFKIGHWALRTQRSLPRAAGIPPVIEFPSSRTAVFYCNSPYTRSYSIYLLPGDSPFRLPAAGEPAPLLPRNRNRKRKCRLHSPGNTSIVENGRTMHRILLLIHNIDMQQSAGYAMDAGQNKNQRTILNFNLKSKDILSGTLSGSIPFCNVNRASLH